MAKSPDLADLIKRYSSIFPGTNRHHPMPVSRMPRSSTREDVYENNAMVFPYKKKAHRAYHALFWNMRIDQVWDNLEDIHNSIFNTDDEEISEWWKGSCDLESGDFFERTKFISERDNRLLQSIRIAHLQSLWLRTFGGEDLVTAENLLKIMMLFMIFGPRIVDSDELFDNGNLSNFFENTKLTRYRLWAFQTLFGEGGSMRGIKSKISNILSRDRFYSV